MRIRLGGQVISNDSANLYRRWGYTDLCCPNDVRNALRECPEDEELILELNSGGGSVYTGFEMYTAIRSSGRAVTAEVQSIAGSAMSVIMAACNKVLMSPVANVMIHRAAAGTYGNSEDHRQAEQMLDTIDKSILNAYTEKAGGKTSKTQFAAMMRKETFMTAQEAIDCGLADGMLEPSGSVEPMNIAASSYGAEDLARVMCALPPIEDLIQMEKERLNPVDQTANSQNNNKHEEESEQTMDIKDIQTKEQLMGAFPELTAQIMAAAQTAERDRITDIDNVALPGFESIISAAKADPAQNAGTVAMAIIAEQKKQGANYMAGAAVDAETSGANNVAAAPVEEVHKMTEEEEAVAAAKAAVALYEGGAK